MCNGGHGGWLLERMRHGAAPCAVAPLVLLAALALFAPRARAADARDLARDRAPRIVWAGEGRVYVAMRDSGALAPGLLVRVFEREREIAAGEITRVLDGVLASVRLASGAVAADARFDRLEVVLETAPVRPVATLRVGLPAAGRRAIVPPCDVSRLDASALPRAYRSEALADGGARLVAADTSASASPWPDTLLVRRFADRADEEIALERGELDVAVFWPGEPSARLRDRASGFELLRGALARGALVAGRPASRPEADAALAARLEHALAQLNAELFGGDLQPLRARDGAQAAPGAAPPAAGGLLRYAVDDALPGARAMERFLNRSVGTARTSAVFVRHLDVPVASLDSLAAAGAFGEAAPVYVLRCPVLCGAARAADVRALGAERFANLLECVAARKRP